MARTKSTRPPGLDHLGGDRWRVRIYAGLDPVTKKPRQLQRTFHANGIREAAPKAEKLRTALRDEMDERRAAKGTVGELVESFLKAKRVDRSPSTVARYEAICAEIVATFGKQPAAKLTARQIEAWYDQLRTVPRPRKNEPLSAQSVAHYHAVLRAVLRRGARLDMVDRVATAKVEAPRVDSEADRPPTPAVVQLVVAASRSLDLGVALHVLAYTGLRRGELVGLRWSDLTDDGRITVRRAIVQLKPKKKGGQPILHEKLPKGRKSRTFTLDESTCYVLAVHRQRLEERASRLGGQLGPDWCVFADLRADPTGQRPRPPSWLSHGWIRLRDRLGVDARLHDLRHANATWMVDAGVPFTVGADRLGHTDRKMFTNRYAHSTDEGDVRAAVALAALAPPKS